jgi:hypothetical protein
MARDITKLRLGDGAGDVSTSVVSVGGAGGLL